MFKLENKKCFKLMNLSLIFWESRKKKQSKVWLTSRKGHTKIKIEAEIDEILKKQMIEQIKKATI